MTQQGAPSIPSHGFVATVRWQGPHPAGGGELLEGVAAQDRLVALFDDGADAESRAAPTFD